MGDVWCVSKLYLANYESGRLGTFKGKSAAWLYRVAFLALQC